MNVKVRVYVKKKPLLLLNNYIGTKTPSRGMIILQRASDMKRIKLLFPQNFPAEGKTFFRRKQQTTYGAASISGSDEVSVN